MSQCRAYFRTGPVFNWAVYLKFKLAKCELSLNLYSITYWLRSPMSDQRAKRHIQWHNDLIQYVMLTKLMAVITNCNCTGVRLQWVCDAAMGLQYRNKISHHHSKWTKLEFCRGKKWRDEDLARLLLKRSRTATGSILFTENEFEARCVLCSAAFEILQTKVALPRRLVRKIWKPTVGGMKRT